MTPRATTGRLNAPLVTELSPDACEALLARNHVGRLAYTVRGAPDVEPLHYVYRDGVINCRTSPGVKLSALEHSPYVAFEADEVDGLWAWRSVVARGTAYLPCPDGSPHDTRGYREAVEALRELVPEALTDRDPVPQRATIVRIHVHAVHGREARPDGL